VDHEDCERYLDAETLRLVRFKANQIAGRYGFARDEVEDIQQTLIAECLERLPRFDPRRGAKGTFARFVINHRIATLVRSQKAPCRDYSRRRSLNSSRYDADSTSPEACKIISVDDYHSRMGPNPRPVEQSLGIKHDVQRAIDALPPELRRICCLLMVLDRIAQVATAAGISRATLHRRMRTIQDAFSCARLHDYIR
jgi:RNA polymerase sigma factor (sigma-70 family)